LLERPGSGLIKICRVFFKTGALHVPVFIDNQRDVIVDSITVNRGRSDLPVYHRVFSPESVGAVGCSLFEYNLATRIMKTIERFVK
jgi:hypothetical protein